MKRKTIWLLNHYAITPSQGGGTRHYNFAKELSKRGYNVYVFASGQLHNNNGSMLSDQEEYRVDTIEGFKWVWINTRKYSGNGRDRALGMLDYYRFLTRKYKIFEKPDVIIGSSVHPFACLAGIKISRKIGARSISEIRDLWPQTLIDMGKLTEKSLMAKILYWLENRIYIKSDRIIVTAAGMKDYIINRGIEGNKITYINNGTDVQAFLEQAAILSEEAEKILKENSDRFLCIYSGAIGAANYLDNLVLAAETLQRDSQYDKIRLIIVGNGPEKKRLEAMSSQKGLTNLKFYDSIKKESIPSLLVDCDVALFNLKRVELLKYGLSANKLFDYMCSAKPVIFSCETSGDYVKQSSCGYSIEPERPDLLAEAILKLYGTAPEAREEMGARGRKFVEENFDVPILVNKLEEVITFDEDHQKTV
jgi:glycosyltransferase involved in cell wall biosynthesis